MRDLNEIREMIKTSLQVWILWWLVNIPLASNNDFVRPGPTLTNRFTADWA